MRILLINPPLLDFEFNKEYTPPLSLLYLASVLLQDGVEVKIMDLNIYKPWEMNEKNYHFCEQAILDEISVFKPALVGLTCMFSGQFLPVLAFANRIKDSYKHIHIAIGGMHPTIFVDQIMANCPSIDYVVIGEGEPQIVALVKALSQGNYAQDLSGIEGIAYRLHGKIIKKPKIHFLEHLDELPFPAYNLINIEDYYHPTSHWHNPKNLSFQMTVPIISSRSCPNKCNFCANYMLMGDRIRFRSPQKIVDEIESAYNQYGQNHFSFMDDNLTMNRKHILNICNEIIHRKLNIQFETPNGVFVNSLNHEIIDRMVNAGWVRGTLAIEHGSDFIRNKIMGKKLSREKILEIVSILKSYSTFYSKGAFIIGMPEETPETIMDTFNLINEIELDEVFVTNIMPYPGTRIYDQSIRDNLFVDEFNTKDLWKMIGFHYHNNMKFYIKPYKMKIEELDYYRERFDALIEENSRKRRSRRSQHDCN